MGNTNTSSIEVFEFHKIQKKDKYTDIWTLNDKDIKTIEEKYKVIHVDYLHPLLVKSKMFGDEYFKSSKKKEVVNTMLDHYTTHNDKDLYERIDYLCDRREQICICNTHADDLRKIYEGINYKPNEKYVSWLKTRETLTPPFV
jgi:hypothetical protein